MENDYSSSEVRNKDLCNPKILQWLETVENNLKEKRVIDLKKTIVEKDKVIARKDQNIIKKNQIIFEQKIRLRNRRRFSSISSKK